MMKYLVVMISVVILIVIVAWRYSVDKPVTLLRAVIKSVYT